MDSVHGARAVTPDGVLHDVTIWHADGRIIRVDAGRPSVEQPGSKRVEGDSRPDDDGGLTLVPGLIDVHTHGADGAQVIDGTDSALGTMAAFYARHGVTGFLAGVFGSQEQIEAGIDACVRYLEDDTPSIHRGAALLGIYLEGPFLNPRWGGAFIPDTILAPNLELLESYLHRARGHLRLLTLAPELEGAEELIELAKHHGVVCALGHSDATYEEANWAAEKGVTHVTHAFNAMRSLHHREPGAIGAALTDDRFSVEVIADGVHLHPATIRLLLTKPSSKVVLVTDSVPGAGLPAGRRAFRDVDVVIKGGEVRLPDGRLAGSTLTMERGLFNLIHLGGAALEEAVSMATVNPATLIGLGSVKGQLMPGFDADITALTSDFRVAWTMVGGRIVYLAPDTQRN